MNIADLYGERGRDSCSLLTVVASYSIMNERNFVHSKSMFYYRSVTNSIVCAEGKHVGWNLAILTHYVYEQEIKCTSFQSPTAVRVLTAYNLQGSVFHFVYTQVHMLISSN